jgi:hypothetical protein
VDGEAWFAGVGVRGGSGDVATVEQVQAHVDRLRLIWESSDGLVDTRANLTAEDYLALGLEGVLVDGIPSSEIADDLNSVLALYERQFVTRDRVVDILDSLLRLRQLLRGEEVTPAISAAELALLGIRGITDENLGELLELLLNRVPMVRYQDVQFYADWVAVGGSPQRLVLAPQADGFVVLFDPVDGAEGYEILISPSDGAWRPQRPDERGSGSEPFATFLVSGYEPGSVVEIWVRAVVGAHKGEPSLSVRGVVGAPRRPVVSTRVVGTSGLLEFPASTRDFAFDLVVVNLGDLELESVWVEPVALPAGLKVVELTVPRGFIRTFSAYPNHWFWEGAGIEAGAESPISIRVRLQEVE